VSAKIRAAARRVDRDLVLALAAIPPLRASALCHGDMHPSNVILTDDGPMIVDWFDASRGDPVGDVARSLLLLSASAHGAAAARHLDHVAVKLVDRALVAYRAAAVERFAIDADALERWRAVLAVARVAEGFDPDGLVAVWRRWQDGAGSGADLRGGVDGVAEVVEDRR
jgi:aminoglycoside phosphotransferase (APT) family kinase protein